MLFSTYTCVDEISSLSRELELCPLVVANGNTFSFSGVWSTRLNTTTTLAGDSLWHHYQHNYSIKGHRVNVILFFVFTAVCLCPYGRTGETPLSMRVSLRTPFSWGMSVIVIPSLLKTLLLSTCSEEPYHVHKWFWVPSCSHTGLLGLGLASLVYRPCGHAGIVPLSPKGCLKARRSYEPIQQAPSQLGWAWQCSPHSRWSSMNTPLSGALSCT